MNQVYRNADTWTNDGSVRSYLLPTHMKQTSRVRYHSVCLTRESLISFEKTVSLPNNVTPLLCGASFSRGVTSRLQTLWTIHLFSLQRYLREFLLTTNLLIAFVNIGQLILVEYYQANLVVYVQPLLVATTSFLRQWLDMYVMKKCESARLNNFKSHGLNVEWSNKHDLFGFESQTLIVFVLLILRELTHNLDNQREPKHSLEFNKGSAVDQKWKEKDAFV